MSHLPLLRKDAHHAPRLQSPRRGPQVCACLLLTGVCALMLPLILSIAESLAGGPLLLRNATTVAPPPPDAVHRLRAAVAVPGVLNGAQRATVEEDLLASVGWLLERSLAAR